MENRINVLESNENHKYNELENKIANYANLKATDLPTVQRLYPPKPSTIQKEVIMQSVKDKMLRKVHEYLENKCNDKGFIKKYLKLNLRKEALNKT